MLPATRHKWTHPALTPAMQAGTRFTYPGGMEGWVDNDAADDADDDDDDKHAGIVAVM